MRRVFLVALLLVGAVGTVGLAACSGGDPEAGPSAAAPGSSDGAVTDGESPPPPAGTATDKDTCQTITTKFSEWGTAFGAAAEGLGDAGSDAAKVGPVVDQIKAANSKFAGELRAAADKTSDGSVKKVANDMAGALDKMNSELDPSKIAEDPGALAAAFDQPQYVDASTEFEKVCVG